MSTREKAADTSIIRQNIRPVGIAVAAGAASCMLMLVLFAFVMSTQSVPQSLVSPIATLAICVGAFVAGQVAARLIRENGLIWGAVCGTVLSFMLLLASFGIDDSGLGVPALFKVAFILLSSMLGGVLGVNTRRKRRRK